ncbi:ABC transporter substrate-binding protein [Malaciobacter canalis]|uniref:ABC transporter substrate-binding protein n=1 Tax=Malaciobacter canalis TaxID=1912871 RepID=A0ABX4LLE3_9BACT|nr:MlaD family protein [Malaciobacter canalis]PHO08587.1 ABC transporter substrate-binding protein [Malaciobacter canalis]QEE31826.1 lipid asymmetry ABC transporter MlaABCDEF, periplasmic component MlaD [Malaciobacter canalis]
MQTKINFFKIGTFVIVLFVLMLIFIFWLGKYAFVVTKQDAYTIYFKESVSGLNIDSPVKFKGVQVGKVENISINPKNSEEIKIKISVIENTPIKKDNYATLGTLGLTGLKYIELKGGSKNSNLIQENKYNEKVIDSKISVLGNLENSSKDISKQLTQLLIQTRILFSNENINNFSKLLDASKQTALNTQEITQYIVNNENKLTQILNNLNDLSITSKSSFNNMSDSANSVKESALKVMELSQKVLNEVEKGSFDLKTISQSTIDNFNNVLNQFENNLIKSEELIEQLKENPSDILFKNNKQKLGPGE